MAVDRCEYLSAKPRSSKADAILAAMQRVVPGPQTITYKGMEHWLMGWGSGFPAHTHALRLHVERGRPAAFWDMGYGYTAERHYRVSLNGPHPTPEQMQRAPTTGRALDAALRDDADPDGPILLVGMGVKSRRSSAGWERKALVRLREQYPGRRIVYRPKPGSPSALPDIEQETAPDIAEALRGKSLVVCRHSNVGVDAAVAGVPVQTEEGAAKWLEGKPFTPEARADFLARVAWWQWQPSEAEMAWDFLRRMA